MKYIAKLGLMCLIVFCGLTAFSQTDSLQVGDTAPQFSGMNQFDSLVSSQMVLNSSDNYVLIFYRGSWCKYCRKHLSALSDSLPLILAKNTSVIVVTPETPESRERIESDFLSSFSIIYDSTYSIMNSFGVSFKISKETVPKFRENTIRLTKKSNGNEDGVLPIPATYIVGKDGIIKWKHVDMNYTQRSTIKEILEEL